MLSGRRWLKPRATTHKVRERLWCRAACKTFIDKVKKDPAASGVEKKEASKSEIISASAQNSETIIIPAQNEVIKKDEFVSDTKDLLDAEFDPKQ